MANKARIKLLEKRHAGDPEPLIMVFTQDLNNPDLFKCDDGTEYTRAEMNALKDTDNQKIIKYLITCRADKQPIVK